MNIVRWDPFRELEQVSERLNRVFGRPAGRESGEGGLVAAEWAPVVDIQETDKEFLIKAELPEVRKEDVKVEIAQGVLCIEGERKHEKEEKGRKFHRIEQSYGKFLRTFALPADVDQKKVAAEFKDGVLHVHLAKTDLAKPKAIEVKVA